MNRSEVNITHPESADLAFLYGTILTDGNDTLELTTTNNVCIFADRQVGYHKKYSWKRKKFFFLKKPFFFRLTVPLVVLVSQPEQLSNTIKDRPN